ncbi:MAG: hypothetical protein AAFR81_25110 [Chloroflexota bacterium]
MRKTHFISLMLLACLLVTFNMLSLAQDDDVTATPGPSKTPDATIAEPTAVAESATESVSETSEFGELPRSYTQQDLNVLVGNVQRPNGIVYYDDFLWTACNGDWTLYRIDAVTGETITFVFGVRDSHQLIAEETEIGFNLWIPDFGTDQLVRLDQSASSPQLITSDNLDGPWGIVEYGETDFLISNLRSNNIVLADRNGNTNIVLEDLRAPAGMATDGEVVFVANNSSARRAIEWFAIDNLEISEDNIEVAEDITQPLVSGIQNASGIVLADDGYLYFNYALGTNGVVGRVNPTECMDGGCGNEDVEIVLLTDLTAPLAGLTITPEMRLFVHTIYRPELYWVDLYE